MNWLNITCSQHQTENFYTFIEDSMLYSCIKEESRIGLNQISFLKWFTVHDDENCFWWTFSAAYYHHKNHYPQIKAQTHYWIKYVLQQQNHIQHNLYDCLNIRAEASIIKKNDLLNLTLQQQLWYVWEWMSTEMFQTVTDCFDIKLIFFKLFIKKESTWSVIVQEAHNQRQILIYMNFKKNHYNALMHNMVN